MLVQNETNPNVSLFEYSIQSLFKTFWSNDNNDISGGRHQEALLFGIGSDHQRPSRFVTSQTSSKMRFFHGKLRLEDIIDR